MPIGYESAGRQGRGNVYTWGDRLDPFSSARPGTDRLDSGRPDHRGLTAGRPPYSTWDTCCCSPATEGTCPSVTTSRTTAVPQPISRAS